MGNQECSGAKIKVIFSAWFFPFLQIVIKWHVGIRRFSLSSEMPKNRQSRRKPKAMIRKLQPRQHWCSPALCAGWVWGWSGYRKGFPFHVEIVLPVISMKCFAAWINRVSWHTLVIFLLPFCSPRCLIPKHSSSTLRASTRNPLFPLSWKGWRHKQWLMLPTYRGPYLPYFCPALMWLDKVKKAVQGGYLPLASNSPLCASNHPGDDYIAASLPLSKSNYLTD